MSLLRVTLLDVGAGDSLFVESVDQRGTSFYALIDSNDTVESRSSQIYLRRFFERLPAPPANPHFEWVLLTHAHTDHSSGLKRLLRSFGAKRFWYSRTRTSAAQYPNLIRFVNTAPEVHAVDVIDSSKVLPRFGDVQMTVMWPPPNSVSANENDNSVVLALSLDQVTFVLTGDSEADGVWSTLSPSLPNATRVFKVPHHGAINGTFDSYGNTPWLSALPPRTHLAISCHKEPHQHPNATVVNALASSPSTLFRTDLHQHITFETDGVDVRVQFSHV
ncbi:MAG: ComEC/Rec2 family competence protein [Vicinamibacterales bacterium]